MTSGAAPLPAPARADWRVLAALAAIGPVAHLAAALLSDYGYFIDEFYYLSCARRLAFGYVDHPPLAPLLLRGVIAIFGDGLVAIRVLPAGGSAALILLTGWLASRFGGGRGAQAVAACAALASPYLLLVFGFYSMNWLEPLLWTALAAIVVEGVRRHDARLWLVFGVVLGIGFETKHTMLIAAASMIAGVAATRERRLLVSGWLIGGGVAALLLAAPNVLWQIAYGWPSLEFYRNADLLKNVPTAPLAVLANQVLFMNPAAAPVWIAGLYYLLLGDGRRWRALGLAYLVLLALLIATRSSRPDRLGPYYPILLAAGGAAIEQASRRWRVLLPAMTGVVCVGGLALAPLGVPILPPAQLARYVAALGVVPQIERGEGKVSPIPQWYADRTGWPELVRDVADVYRSLPEDERHRTIVIAPSYGQAGALELLWPDGSPPPIISPHNTWFFWSRDVLSRLPFDVAIGVGQRETLSHVYADVTQVGVHRCDYCTAWRDRMPLFVARHPTLDRDELLRVWEAARHFE